MSYKKLDPEFKAKWLEALRSQTYCQTTGSLRKGPFQHVDPAFGFCCIGVAAHLVDPNGWVGGDRGTYAMWHGYITNNVGEKLGIDPTAISALVNMNDVEHKTFPEIADWIEANL